MPYPYDQRFAHKTDLRRLMDVEKRNTLDSLLAPPKKGESSDGKVTTALEKAVTHLLRIGSTDKNELAQMAEAFITVEGACAKLDINVHKYLVDKFFDALKKFEFEIKDIFVSELIMRSLLIGFGDSGNHDVVPDSYQFMIDGKEYWAQLANKSENHFSIHSVELEGGNSAVECLPK